MSRIVTIVGRTAARARARLAGEAGVSLIELTVAIPILIVVLGATLAVLSEYETNANVNRDDSDSQDRARQGLGLLVRELRNIASPTEVEHDPIDKATDNDIVFQTVGPKGPAPAGNPANIRRVRYCLDTSDANNHRLRFQEQTWDTETVPPAPSTTSCPDSDPEWHGTSGSTSSSRILAEHVVNTRSAGRPIFRYRATTAACAVAPVTGDCLPELVGVRAKLFMDVNGADEEPAEVPLESGVTLRNQNRAPTASFEATPVGPYEFLLNATASFDPEGEKLRYEWWLDVPLVGPVKMGEGAIFKTPVLSIGTHSIELRVIDSGGLVSKQEVTVSVPAL